MQTLQATWQRLSTYNLAPFFLIGLFFVEPLSSTAKSIFLGLAVLSIIFTPCYRDNLAAIFRKPWSLLALSLFFLALTASFWSPASWGEKWLVIEKYSKFVYLPLLTLGFMEADTRRKAVHAFLAGMLLTCILSILQSKNIIPGGQVNADAIFRNHIMTGIMMSFAAYLSAYYFFQGKTTARYAYALVYLLCTYQVLFISTGRTGYVIYFLLMTTLACQLFSRKQALIAITLILALFAVCYKLSPAMNFGIHQVKAELDYYHAYKDTSVGYRLQFHNFAKQLFKQHPLFGNGTASFTYEFKIHKPVPSWDRRLLEPHSQYWLIAVEFGLAGILLFAAFYLGLLSAANRLREYRFTAFALLLVFAVGNISDSLLFYSGSGYFFIAFMALCLGESLQNKGREEITH
ncbi:hypothetical protein B1207_05355 [Legionella quinlivanii]|uniref:O-antigen ligase-related domain-containing protein n=1 Tax=Legionella quinlivanii TaxID=45073 RepID=A0A364LLI1_9GAMM|nr:O-antigen ligase family protein [Legionella quinlivanii]RAP37600.1 hypothetical protein B1207_05355 [Legionella quinlivanii]